MTCTNPRHEPKGAPHPKRATEPDDDVDEEGDYEEEDEDYEGGDEDDDDDDELDECGSELAYEDYVYSDED